MSGYGIFPAHVLSVTAVRSAGGMKPGEVGRLRDGVSPGFRLVVDAGHEFPVGGACGGEFVVTVGELDAEVGGLLFEPGDRARTAQVGAVMLTVLPGFWPLTWLSGCLLANAVFLVCRVGQIPRNPADPSAPERTVSC